MSLPPLVVRRRIAAPATLLYEALTEPAELVAWWGPEGTTCTGAEADPRVGGRYRIENRLDDGQLVVIVGEYLDVQPPHALKFTWGIEGAPAGAPVEHVTVRLEGDGEQTEVIVTHERITDEARRASHSAGWTDCLAGLARYASSTVAGSPSS